MKRATVTFPDELAQALQAYPADQEVPLALTAVVQAALRDYLAERGYLPSASLLKITPASREAVSTKSARLTTGISPSDEAGGAG